MSEITKFLAGRLNVHLREVLKNTSIALSLKLLGTVFAFGFSVLLARILGAHGAGTYFLALTLVTIASVFGRVGLDNTLLRFTAANASVGDWISVKGIYSKGIVFAVAASGIAVMLLFTMSPWLANSVFRKPELSITIRWLSLAIIPVSILILHSQLLKGLKRIRDSQLVESVNVPVICLIAFGMFGRTHGVLGAVWSYVAASVTAALLGIWLWRRATRAYRHITGEFDTRDIFKSSLPLFWVASMNLVFMWTTTLLLGVWGSSSDVGIFNVASRTAKLTSLILVAVNSIVAPKFAELYKKGEIETLSELAQNSLKLTTFLASPLLILFLLVPNWIMQLFGPQFVGGTAVLMILAVGQFVNASTGPVGFLLMMSGNEKAVRNNITVAAGLNLVLNVFLIPQYSIIGAAVATSLAIATMNILHVFSVKRYLNIWIISLTRTV